MEKKNAPFMLAFVAILLCSSSSSILCSNMELADEDIGGSCGNEICNNRTCNISSDCITPSCPSSCQLSCNIVGYPHEHKICGPRQEDYLALIQLPMVMAPHHENISVI